MRVKNTVNNELKYKTGSVVTSGLQIAPYEIRVPYVDLPTSQTVGAKKYFILDILLDNEELRVFPGSWRFVFCSPSASNWLLHTHTLFRTCYNYYQRLR